jgi:hypothetical protein
MNFIQKHQILGRVSVFVWRIEYQKDIFHMLISSFWTDFDTQGIDAVDAVTSARYLKTSPLFNDQGMVSDFRQLIDAYQIHQHSKRCRLPNGKCRFGYPQEMAGHTRIRGYKDCFCWDAEEKILCLLTLRCWHPFRLIIISNPFRTMYRIRSQVLRKEF